MFGEFGFAFCVSEVFPIFFEYCVEVSVGSSYIKSVAVGACQLKKPLPVIFVVINDLKSNCQLPKPGDRGNYKTCWKGITPESVVGLNILFEFNFNSL